VAVVGAVNADYIVRVDRLPQPGETVTGGRLSIRPGGKGANQAHAAARLGADVLLVASVGADGVADDERAALTADGVETSGLTARPGPTGLAVVRVDASGENAIAVAGAANDQLDPATVTERLGGWLDPGSVLLCSLEIPLAAAVAAAGAAAAAGALPVITPAPARPLPPALVRGAILTPNEGELVRMAPGAEGEPGRMALGAEGEQAAVSRLLDCGARAVVVTRGRRGASVFAPAQPPVTIGAPAVEVVDTVGAGDAFNGALAWSLACGAPLSDAVTAAAAAGAAACTGTGARDALPTPAALSALLGREAFAAACPPA
jgi:ribokinase